MAKTSYEKKFDVVIVGAGVIGCSIAYFLAKESQGRLKVGVLERNAVGEESSSGAAGMLAVGAEFNPTNPLFSLALESRNMFPTLAEELKEISEVDIQFLKSGIASIAFEPKEEEELKNRLREQKPHALGCKWISPEEISRIVPFLQARSLGGLWSPQDGHVSSSRLTLAFCEAAKKLGVSFFEFENVEKFNVKPGKLEFLKTGNSKFIAEKFIFATGSWTGKLLGLAAPVSPMRGQILLFEIPKNWLALHSWKIPLYLGETPHPNPIGCYMVPKMDGHVWVGASMENRGFDKSENKEATEKLANYACSVFPDLSTFPFKGVWVGFRPGTADRLPILGKLPQTDNLFVASGHFRNGILLSPITGKHFAELILYGKSNSFERFSPDRFLNTTQR